MVRQGSHPDHGRASSRRQRRRQTLRRELQVFLLLTAYFTLFLGSLTVYRRLLLAESGIAYAHYGIALIQGAVLAKLLLLAEASGIGRWFRRGPLALTIGLLTAGSAVFILLTGLVEHLIKGLVEGAMPAETLSTLLQHDPADPLGRLIVLLLSLLPLIAFLELGKRIGFRRLRVLLFSTHRLPSGRRLPR